MFDSQCTRAGALQRHLLLGKVTVRNHLVVSCRSVFMEARRLFCGRGLGRMMLKYFFGQLEGWMVEGGGQVGVTGTHRESNEACYGTHNHHRAASGKERE